MNKPNKNDQKRLLKQLRRIHKLLAQKKFQKAESVVKELLEEFPYEPLLHIAHSMCFSVRGEYEDALEILEQANEKIPNQSNILFRLAEILDLMEKPKKAEHLYRRSIELTPPEHKTELTEAYTCLGLLLWHQAPVRKPWRCGVKL